MARCDEGYRCEVCGQDVEAIVDSGLYLLYVLGDVPLESLHLRRERHIHCHPELAQFIVDPAFAPVACPGPFAKELLDPAFVNQEEQRVTCGWRRLQAIPALGLTLAEYPLAVTPERIKSPTDENTHG
jgi:hypothetical protein